MPFTPESSATNTSDVASLVQGMTATFTATASGGTAPPSFQFYLNIPGTGFVQEQAYSTTTTYAWVTSTGWATGTYTSRVWAKAAGSTNAWDTFADSGNVVLNAAVTSVTLAISPATPQTRATTMTLTATPTGGVATVSNAFYYSYAGGAFTLFQAYSTSTTASWNPESGAWSTGSYVWRVLSRSSGSTNSYDAFGDTSAFTLNNAAFTQAASVAVTAAFAYTRRLSRTITQAVTATLAPTKRFIHTYTQAVTASASGVKQFIHTYTTSGSGSPSAVKQFIHTYTVASTGAVSVVKRFIHTYTVSVSAALALVRLVGLGVPVTSTGSYSVPKQVQPVAISRAVTASAVRSSQVGTTKTVAVVAAASAATPQLLVRTLTVAVSGALALVRQARKPVSLAVTGALALARQVNLNESVTSTGSYSFTQQVQPVLTLAVTAAASALKGVRRTTSVAVAVVAASTARVGRSSAVATVAALAVVRQAGKLATTSGSATLSRVLGVGLGLPATSTATSSFTQQVQPIVTLVVTAVVSVVKRLPRSATVAVSAVVSGAKLVPRSGSAAVAAVLARLLQTNLTLTATGSSTGSFLRQVQAFPVVAVTAVVSVLRGVRKPLSLAVSVLATGNTLQAHLLSYLSTALNSVARQVQPVPLSVAVIGVASRSTQLQRSLAVAVGAVLSRSNRVGQTWNVATTAAASRLSQVRQTWSVAVTALTARTSLLPRAGSVVVTAALSRTNQVGLRGSTAVTTVLVTTRRLLPTAFVVAVSAAVSYQRRLARSITLAVTAGVTVVRGLYVRGSTAVTGALAVVVHQGAPVVQLALTFVGSSLNLVSVGRFLSLSYLSHAISTIRNFAVPISLSALAETVALAHKRMQAKFSVHVTGVLDLFFPARDTLIGLTKRLIVVLLGTGGIPSRPLPNVITGATSPAPLHLAGAAPAAESVPNVLTGYTRPLLSYLYGNIGLNRQNIEFYAGDNKVVTLTLYQDGTTTVQNISTWGAFTLRLKANAADLDGHALVSVVGVKTDATHGVVTFTLTPTMTNLVRRNAFYSVKAIDNLGNTQTVATGPVVAKVS